MVDADIRIDPDIRTASTLPARVYSDPAIFQRYSPTRETGIHHFHRLLVGALQA